VRGEADINGLASKSANSAGVMVWNYHDDNVPAPDAQVKVSVKGLPAQKMMLYHYRIDKENSNSYEVWKSMGSPKSPSAEQIRTLEKAGQLELLTSPEWITPKNGSATVDMKLPRQGVSFLHFKW